MKKFKKEEVSIPLQYNYKVLSSEDFLKSWDCGDFFYDYYCSRYNFQTNEIEMGVYVEELNPDITYDLVFRDFKVLKIWENSEKEYEEDFKILLLIKNRKFLLSYKLNNQDLEYDLQEVVK